MGYYIKITGRGYLKNFDENSAHYASKFSKQLTLAYCADTKSEAQAYKDNVLKTLASEARLVTEVYEVASKIKAFPELFKSKEQVIKFINDQGLDEVTHKNAHYDTLVHYFRSKAIYIPTDFKECMNKFLNKDSSYSGFKYIESCYKSAVNTLNLISKGKIIEQFNNEVTLKKTSLKKATFYKSKDKDTVNYTSKIYCDCCGASIPGAIYLGGVGSTICPYCLIKFAEKAEDNIKKLGPEIEKAYKKALFIKSL